MSLNRRFLRVVIGSLLSTMTMCVNGCTCLIPPTFCESMQPDMHPANAVILGVKLDDYYYGMRVKVLESLLGPDMPGDTITVWGSYDGGGGGDCRVPTDSWLTGDTLFAGFHTGDLLGNFFAVGFPPDLEQVGSYVTSLCGTFYLSYEAGIVTGPITQGVPSATIGQMSAHLSGCSVGVAPQATTEANVSIRTTSTSWELVIAPRLAGPVALDVFDLAGRKVFSTAVHGDMVLVPRSLGQCLVGMFRSQVVDFIVRLNTSVYWQRNIFSRL